MRKALLPWIWFSNLHIVFVASGVLLSAYALGGVPVDWPYVIVACSGALLVYHVDRAFLRSPEDLLNAPERVKWLDSHKRFVRVSSGAAFVGIGFGSIQLSSGVLVVGVGMGAIGLLYSVPFLNGARRLKDLSFAKGTMIIMCWIGGGVVLPLAGNVNPTVLMLLVAYRASYLIPNLYVADWVDCVGDRMVGNNKWKPLHSVGRVRFVALGAVLAAVGFCVALFVYDVPGILLLVDLIGVIATGFLVSRKTEWTSKHVVLLDLLVGLPVLTWIVYTMTP